MTAPLADLMGAFIAHTKVLPNTAALVGSRVSSRVRVKSTADPAGWDMPTYAIVWREVPGPIGGRTGTVPIDQQPMQVECYGPDLKAARLLFRTLHAELFPELPTPQSFKAAGCAVLQMQRSGGAAPLMDSPTDYPRVVQTYLVEYCERPV